MNSSNYMEYRDFEYENNNLGYDDIGQYGIKCKNYDLCHHTVSLEHYECFANYLCMTCGSWFKLGSFGWDELEFRNCPENEECYVCFGSEKQVKFPANCGHWFCCNCSRDILFWDETRYHLSPEPYGCLPCPNGCINPIRGKQCYCYEYFGDDENPGIIQIWKRDHPEQYEKYNDDENESIELSETTHGSVFASKKCPLCRKEYEK